MSECQISHEHKNGVDILKLEGSLDAYTMNRLQAVFQLLDSEARYQVALDCTGLGYISSVALWNLRKFA